MQLIDKENGRALNEHKKGVASVNFDVRNKYEILKQINEFKPPNYELKMLENLEKELNVRRQENFDLQEKLENLQNDQRGIERNRNLTIKNLKEKIRGSQHEINQLSHRDERDTKSKLRVRPKSSVNLSKQVNKSAIILNTIRNDVKEISSLITVKFFYKMH